MHKEHKLLMINKSNEFKRKVIDLSLSFTHEDIYQLGTVKSFAIDKAKYLIKVNLLIGIFHGETYGNAFIARMTKKNFPISGNINENGICYVMTNSSFEIQTFTTNSFNIIGFNSNFVNSNVDITKMIKQFYEGILKGVVDLEIQSNSEKMKIKQEIANKYLKSPFPLKINFKSHETGNEIQFKRNSKSGLTGSCFGLAADVHLVNPSQKKSCPSINLNEDTFFMKIEKIIINNKHQGYLFRFQPVDLLVSSSDIKGSPGKF